MMNVRTVANRRPVLAAATLGGASAVMFALAFPPFHMWPLAFVALVPLFTLAGSLERGGRAGIIVSLMWLGVWLFHQRWVMDVTMAGYPLLAMYLSVYPGVFVWMVVRMRRSATIGRAPVWIIAPIVWTGLEVVRGSVVFYGYPWFLVGHPTIEWTNWASCAGVLGAYGVSWMTAIVNGLIAQAVVLKGMKARAGMLGAAVVVIVVGWGAGLGYSSLARTGAVDDRVTLSIAVVQTNVPQDNKMAWDPDRQLADWEDFKQTTLEAAALGPDVIVWPETMFPGMALNADAIAAERLAGLTFRTSRGPTPTTFFADELFALQQSIGIPMLIGASARENLRFEELPDGGVQPVSDASYNSAFVIVDGRVQSGRYDKRHLTPFGEVMPYISWSEWLETKLLDIGAGGMRFDLERGRGAGLLTIPLENAKASGVRVATPICFEATMSGVCRKLATEGEGANLIVNLTNDGWFGDWTGGREQHLQTARWRCIELGTPMVRAANTGISAVIDSRGRLARRESGVDPRERVAGAALWRLDIEGAASTGPRTIYALVGEAPGWTLLGLTLAGLIAAISGDRLGRRGEEADKDGSNAAKDAA